jgi:hypothetical protein
MRTDTGILDEAYERFHGTGPEFDGGLSNHGPMAVEAMVRRGEGEAVHAWIDWYGKRLDELPRGIDPVTEENWREALGAPDRIGDWTGFLLRESEQRPWRELLAEWWPRLLPGILSSATHGVIRVGHAVHALLEQEQAGGVAGEGAEPVEITGGPRVAELAHALASWAVRRPAVLHDAAAARSGLIDPSAALAGVPSVADQQVGVSYRVGQLGGTPGWGKALGALRSPASPEEAAELLGKVADAAVADYLRHGQANPIMMVHASTAPTAVLRALPALPKSLWIPSLDAAWFASAAVTAAYRNAVAPEAEIAAARAEAAADPRENFERAVRHRDEHAVKFADAALASFERTGERDALAAAARVTKLIPQR